jgi:haloalkane dehalogenase
VGIPLPAFCRTTGSRWLPRDRSGLDLSFPRLVPIRFDHPGAFENRIAIERLRRLELPVLLPWGDADPILGKLEPDLRAIFRNVAPPLVVHGAGHFIQEDAGEEVAGHIRIWLGAGR